MTDQSQSVVQLLDQVGKETESNQQVIETLQTVINTYGPQDNTDIMKSVEAIEISPAHDLQQKIAIRDVSFHTIILVPSRVEVTGEFTLSPSQVTQFNAALGY